MQNKQTYLYLTVFIAGMTSLAIELAASRLLGNVFGTSNLVWACIIGLILIYLTVGYFLGGKWADSRPYHRTFYTILAWAGLSVGLIPVISKPILRISANAFDQLQMGALAGAFVSVMILFVVPVILLGTASPFAIRLVLQESETSQSGKISGRIYAISTLGSFIGTFLPVLLLIPLIGTYQTFLFFSALLVLTALAGLGIYAGWKRILAFLWMPLLLIILSVWGVRGSLKNTAGMIYEDESAYNYIQVLQRDGYTMLRLNEGQGVHSFYHPTELNYYGPWEQVLVAPYFNPAPHLMEQVRSLAIVGLAAGTAARQYTAVYGAIPIDGYEIDPQIIQVGKTYFGMDLPNLNAYAVDGRWGLEQSPRRYSVISVDAYRPPYIPAHLVTREFFQIVFDHLEHDGVMVINVGRSPADRSLVNALATTIRTIFPSLYAVDVPGTFNTILFATMQPTRQQNLLENYLALEANPGVHPLLLQTMQIAILSLQPAPEQTQIFTDDLSPIEWITNRMVLDFVLSEDMGELQ